MSYELLCTRGDSREVFASGYSSPGTSLLRVGPYTLKTTDFCRFLGCLPDEDALQFALAVRAGQQEPVMVRMSWEPEQRAFVFGQYALSEDQFTDFAHYVLKGGLSGWRGVETPERAAATTALAALLNNSDENHNPDLRAIVEGAVVRSKPER